MSKNAPQYKKMATDQRQGLLSTFESMHKDFLYIHRSFFKDIMKPKNVQKQNLYQSSIEMIDLVLQCMIIGSRSFKSEKLLGKAQCFVISYISEMDKMINQIRNKNRFDKSEGFNQINDDCQYYKQKSDLDDLLEQIESKEFKSQDVSLNHDKHVMIEVIHESLSDDLNHSTSHALNRQSKRSRRKKNHRTRNSILRNLDKQQAMEIDPQFDDPTQSEIELFFDHCKKDKEENIRLPKYRKIQDNNQSRNINTRSRHSMVPNKISISEEREFLNKNRQEPKSNTINIQKHFNLNISPEIRDPSTPVTTRLNILCSNNQLNLPEFTFERKNNLFVCTTNFLNQRFCSRHLKSRIEAKKELCEFIIHFSCSQ